MSEFTIRTLNLLLRCATLGARFLFIFFLAKFIEPSSVGYYGIFTVTISYSLYLVGLDFYTYVTREVIQTPANQRGRLFKGQAAVSGALYIVLLPLATLLLAQSGWPNIMIWWFLPILVLEHLNQEISRLLTTLSEQLASSCILFIRQGSWNLAVIVIMSATPEVRGLNMIMPLWFLSGVVALGLGIWKLKTLNTSGWSLAIDWSWVKKGLRVSSLFLAATLALRGLQTFDRYWIEALGGIEMVASYVLAQGIASVLLLFLESTLFAFAYPVLIKCYQDGKVQEAQHKVRDMLFQTIFFAAIFSVSSWILLPYFLIWIDNPSYAEASHIYPWILSAVVLNALTMAPHFGLYAQNFDRPIIYSNISALFVFISAAWYLSRFYSSFAILVSLNLAFAWILVWQSLAYFLMIKKQKAETALFI
jgi:O-antigen/teichoic acid export membrane protein